MNITFNILSVKKRKDEKELLGQSKNAIVDDQ